MTDPTLHPLELILRQCAQAAPAPWYPSAYARAAGVPRDSLDPYLDQLRLGGLVRLTDWVMETGQGYTLTPEGKRLLADPRDLARLRAGRLAPQPPAPKQRRAAGDGELSTWERGETVRDAVLQPAPSALARVLIAANVLCFAAGLVLALQRGVPANMYLGGGLFGGQEWRDPKFGREREQYGVVMTWLGELSGRRFAEGEWWRLLSHAFVHRGLVHLAVNMLSLYMLGRFAEQMWGRGRFLLLFLFSAVGGGVLALLYDPDTALVGASGGICGVFGAMGIWIFLNREHLPSQLLFLWTRNVVLNVMLMVFIGMSVKQVSNTGHLGGAALGAVLGGLLSIHRFGGPVQRWLAAAGVVAVPVLCVGFLVYTAAHDPKWRSRRDTPVPHTPTEDLLEHYLPQAQRVDEEAVTLDTKDVQPLLARQAQEREAQVVQNALAGLRDVRSRLIHAANELLQQAGPYTHPVAEKVRVARAKHLRAKAELFDRFAVCLERGAEWREPDQVELLKLMKDVDDLDKQWRQYTR